MREKNELSARFIRAYEYLSNMGLIAGQKDFANTLGISPSMVTEIAKGRSSVGTLAIQNIVSLFEISADWLLTGQGEMLKQNSNDIIHLIHTPKSIEKLDDRSIHLYDVAAAANLKTLFINKDQNILGEILIPDIPLCDGAIYVTGDSMYPLLKSGDIIAYKELHSFDDIIYGETYLVSFQLSGDEYLTVKYIRRSEQNGYIKLVSHNSYHDPKDIPLSSISALAIVKFSIRKNTMI